MSKIELVNLALPQAGFYNFISAWILEDQDRLFVIDPGPTNSLHVLYEALGTRKPDYILLTHIHVDHAGGIGELSRKYPEAKIVAHDKAHRHLLDPAKLIEGSNATLGSLMDLYGPIEPVPKENILAEPEGISGCKIIKTPGHAPHHISFIFDSYIFCGEALGIIYPLGEDLYLRPATPPIFNLENYNESISFLESSNHGQKLCFGHYGFGLEGVNYFNKARDQIELWMRIIRSKCSLAEFNREEENCLNSLIESLMIEDLNFSSFKKLPQEVQERERYFISNTVKGILSLI